LTGSIHTKIAASSINTNNSKFLISDNFSATIEYSDGSVCNLIYSALGSKDFPKEEMTIFCEGEIIRMRDYKTLEIFGNNSLNESHSSADKGQFELLKRTGNFLTNRASVPLTFDEQYRATEISFEVEKLMKK